MKFQHRSDISERSLFFIFYNFLKISNLKIGTIFVNSWLETILKITQLFLPKNHSQRIFLKFIEHILIGKKE